MPPGFLVFEGYMVKAPDCACPVVTDAPRSPPNLAL